MLPASSPLKCIWPADVYTLLKSSDFVLHDLDPERVFEGVEPASPNSTPVPYELELVLRKWYPVDRSRELRCFVRREILIGTVLHVFGMGLDVYLHFHCRYITTRSKLLRVLERAKHAKQSPRRSDRLLGEERQGEVGSHGREL